MDHVIREQIIVFHYRLHKGFINPIYKFVYYTKSRTVNRNIKIKKFTVLALELVIMLLIITWFWL